MEKKHESDLTPAERRKDRFETIRQLKGRARLEYIWEYYKFLLVFVIAAVLVTSTVVTMIRGSQQNIVLSIAIVDANQQTGLTNTELEEQLRTALKLPENEQVKIDTAASTAETEENEAKLGKTGKAAKRTGNRTIKTEARDLLVLLGFRMDCLVVLLSRLFRME